MKIYNNVQYKPNFTGNFVENKYIRLAVDKSDYIARGAFENLCERMKNTADGYIFELISEDAGAVLDQLSKKKGTCLQFMLKISGKTKRAKKEIIYNTDSERGFFGKTEEDCYKGVLRQVNKILKSFYNKPVEQIKEEKSAKLSKDSISFSEFTENSDALQEGTEPEKHDDLRLFDSFFREDENFDRKTDMKEKLNFLYDEDDVELSDNIKSHMFDALF